MRNFLFSLFFSFFICQDAEAAHYAKDTTPKLRKDTGSTKMHNPKIALRRSAMIPGWGQLYNKQGWKIPIIYGALGVTGYIFFDNIKWYNRTRYAFNIRSKTNPTQQEIDNIDPKLINLAKDDLSFYRRTFRRDVDYSVLFFIGLWGLNIADAVVFAHLKNFDVSDNISGTLQLGNSTIANTNGIQLRFNFHGKKSNPMYIVKY